MNNSEEKLSDEELVETVADEQTSPEEPDLKEEKTEDSEIGEDRAPKPAAEEKEEPLQAQLLRLSADFDNFRKRTRREKETWTQQSQERIVTDLLTVVDHFELGLKNAEEHEAKTEVLDGFRMVHNQFVTVMERYGVKPVETGEAAFNPEVHEAVSFMEHPDIAENEIIAETRKGYIMGEKLIRAAQVVVSSGSPEPKAENTGDPEVSEEDA